MQDIQVFKRNDSYYTVILEGYDEYNISVRTTEQAANELGIEPEQVAQMRAILKVAKEGDKSRHIMTYKKFTQGYKQILQKIQPEELICYMLDKPGPILLNPEKLLEEIQREK